MLSLKGLLAKKGYAGVGHHGPSSAMGVPLTDLPRWDDLQILTAQVATKPLLDEAVVGTDLVIGPRARKLPGGHRDPTA